MKFHKFDKVRLGDGRELMIFADDGPTLRAIELPADKAVRIDRGDIVAVRRFQKTQPPTYGEWAPATDEGGPTP